MDINTERGSRGTSDPIANPLLRPVLVVEDNDNDAELLRLLFRRSRILNPLEVVATVHDAMCYLKGEGEYADRARYPFPALVLVDSHLTDGSGFDLLRWLQVHKTPNPLAIVMLTGSDVNAFKTSYELGAHSFLTKPLKFEDFQNMVERVRGIKLTRTAEGHLLEPE